MNLEFNRLKATLFIVKANFSKILHTSFIFGFVYFIFEFIINLINFVSFSPSGVFDLLSLLIESHLSPNKVSYNFSNGFIITFWLKVFIFIIGFTLIFSILLKFITLVSILIAQKVNVVAQALSKSTDVLFNDDLNVKLKGAQEFKAYFNKYNLEDYPRFNQNIYNWSALSINIGVFKELISKSFTPENFYLLVKNLFITSLIVITSIVIYLIFIEVFYILPDNALILSLWILLGIVVFLFNLSLLFPAYLLNIVNVNLTLRDVLTCSIEFAKIKYSELIVLSIVLLLFTILTEPLLHYIYVVANYIEFGIFGRVLVYVVAIFKYTFMITYLVLIVYDYLKVPHVIDQLLKYEDGMNKAFMIIQEDIQILYNYFSNKIMSNNQMQKNGVYKTDNISNSEYGNGIQNYQSHND